MVCSQFPHVLQWSLNFLLASCPPKGAPLLLPLMPQDFGVIDLRHHFAVHSPVGDDLLGGLYGVAIVQCHQACSPPFLPVGGGR